MYAKKKINYQQNPPVDPWFPRGTRWSSPDGRNRAWQPPSTTPSAPGRASRRRGTRFWTFRNLPPPRSARRDLLLPGRRSPFARPRLFLRAFLLCTRLCDVFFKYKKEENILLVDHKIFFFDVSYLRCNKISPKNFPLNEFTQFKSIWYLYSPKNMHTAVKF